MVIYNLWSAPVRRLVAEHLRHFRDTLEILGRSVRERIAKAVGEGFYALVRVLLGPHERPPPPWHGTPVTDWPDPRWDDDLAAEDLAGQIREAQGLDDLAPQPAPAELPKTQPRWLRALSAALETLLWGLRPPGHRRLTAFATGAAVALAALVSSPWAAALVTLAGAVLALIALAGHAATEADHLAACVTP